MATKKNKTSDEQSLISTLMQITGQVAGSTLDLARTTATMTAMFGESWLRSALMKNMEPERLEAMADAGKFLRDARQTAGMSVAELNDALGLSDGKLLRDVESGERIMPLEMMLRVASLIARHDPIPFLIKFMRTYNPALGKTLEQWGILTLPKYYERERRFINLYRQHDQLRQLSDAEFERFLSYMDSAGTLVLDMMASEREAARAGVQQSPTQATAKPKRKAARKKTTPRKATAKPKAKRSSTKTN